MDLVVIVPTRGRPRAAFELAQNFASTCTAETRLVFVVDADDPKLDGYYGTPPTAAIWQVETKGMIPALNHVATLLAEDSFAVGFMGDDHRPRTQGWDKDYLYALDEMRAGIVYGNDLLQGEELPTQCAMTANIIRVLGFMAPPTLSHLYVDNFWRDLGREANCLRYMPDVVVEHMHPLANKSEWDDGYKRVNAQEMYDADSAAYHAWKAANFNDCVAKVRAL